MKTAIIVAAGTGERMKNNESKAFMELAGKPMVSYSLESFQEAKTIDKIVLVVKEPDIDKAKKITDELGIEKLFEVTAGGNERQDSVYLGLTASPPETSIAVIHDAARPLVTTELIDKIVNALDTDGVVPGVPAVDTIKKVQDNIVTETLNREELIAAQTPQAFNSKSLVEAHNIARTFIFYATDDAALMEKQKYKIKVIEGDLDNIKITTPNDLELAEIIIKRRSS